MIECISFTVFLTHAHIHTHTHTHNIHTQARHPQQNPALPATRLSLNRTSSHSTPLCPSPHQHHCHHQHQQPYCLLLHQHQQQRRRQQHSVQRLACSPRLTRPRPSGLRSQRPLLWPCPSPRSLRLPLRLLFPWHQPRPPWQSCMQMAVAVSLRLRHERWSRPPGSEWG